MTEEIERMMTELTVLCNKGNSLPTPRAPAPAATTDGMAEAMGAMDINSRPSMERQRRPTDAIKASQQSSGSSGSRQGNPLPTPSPLTVSERLSKIEVILP